MDGKSESPTAETEHAASGDTSSVESAPPPSNGNGNGHDAPHTDASPPAAAQAPAVPAETPQKRRRNKSTKLTVRRGVPGAPPGTLRVDRRAPKSQIHLMAYGPDGAEEIENTTLDVVRAKCGSRPVLWVRVVGLGDGKALAAIRDLFKLHPLAMEDVVTVVQRPKAEQFGDSWFFVMRHTRLSDQLETQQISLFWGTNYVISFEEKSDSNLEPVRRRIREGLGQARSTGPDYLAYSIIDAMVDHLFPVLESYGERLEVLEEGILSSATEDTLARIQEVKHDLLVLRRSIWPLRDALIALTRDDSRLIRPETRVYMRDCYDHAVQLIDIVESYREFASGLADLLLSSISHRMNEVMKVLTIIATIFIPLSFITGVYGMNFDTQKSALNMPELEWAWGYPFALFLMAGTAGTLLFYFRRKGWIGGAPKPPKSPGAHGS
jgi:magnesium transporter